MRNRPKKLYLAGPMTGIELYNFPAFDAARDQLEATGYEVISPADLDRANGIDGTRKLTDAELAAALRRDFAAIETCGGIALMSGWEDSVGTSKEIRHGIDLGLTLSSVRSWVELALTTDFDADDADDDDDDELVDILDEAKELTSGARQQAYDHPHPNHSRIAGLWNAYDQAKPESRRGFDGPGDVVAKMILLKLARHVFRAKRDNLVDIAGYARCMAMIDDFNTNREE